MADLPKTARAVIIGGAYRDARPPITPAAMGPSLGAVGLGYVPCAGQSAEEVLASRYEIESAGVRLEALASLAPMSEETGRGFSTPVVRWFSNQWRIQRTTPGGYLDPERGGKSGFAAI